MSRYTFVLLAIGTVAAAGAAAALARSNAQIQPPANIAAAGKIVWCSDIEYPPEELYKSSRAVGSDIDIAAGISKLMGVKAQFKNVV